jgi:hypothetical protein
MSKKRKGLDVERDVTISSDSVPAEELQKLNLEMRLTYLLRDACPTWSEIEGEPNAAKRKANERARDIATDALMRIYRDAEKRGLLSKIDYRVRSFGDDLKARNGGNLPAPKGGRPVEEDRYFRIAVYIEEKTKALGGGHGCLEKALDDAADHFGLAYTTVRDIYYDERAREDWERMVELERAWRAWPRHGGD